MPNNCNFSDREMMDDALSSQKFITDGYNTLANECATPALLAEFMNLLMRNTRSSTMYLPRCRNGAGIPPNPLTKTRLTRQNKNSRG